MEFIAIGVAQRETEKSTGRLEIIVENGRKKCKNEGRNKHTNFRYVVTFERIVPRFLQPPERHRSHRSSTMH